MLIDGNLIYTIAAQGRRDCIVELAAVIIERSKEGNIITMTESKRGILLIDFLYIEYEHITAITTIPRLTRNNVRAGGRERITMEKVMLTLTDRDAICVAQDRMDKDMIRMERVTTGETGVERIDIGTGRRDMTSLEIEIIASAEMYIFVSPYGWIDSQVQMGNRVATSGAV